MSGANLTAKTLMEECKRFDENGMHHGGEKGVGGGAGTRGPNYSKEGTATPARGRGVRIFIRSKMSRKHWCKQKKGGQEKGV